MMLSVPRCIMGQVVEREATPISAPQDNCHVPRLTANPEGNGTELNGERSGVGSGLKKG